MKFFNESLSSILSSISNMEQIISKNNEPNDNIDTDSNIGEHGKIESEKNNNQYVTISISNDIDITIPIETAINLKVALENVLGEKNSDQEIEGE